MFFLHSLMLYGIDLVTTNPNNLWGPKNPVAGNKIGVIYLPLFKVDAGTQIGATR